MKKIPDEDVEERWRTGSVAMILIISRNYI